MVQEIVGNQVEYIAAHFYELFGKSCGIHVRHTFSSESFGGACFKFFIPIPHLIGGMFAAFFKEISKSFMDALMDNTCC